MKLTLIAYSPVKFTIVKELRADTYWFADVLVKLTVTMAHAQANALAAVRERQEELQRHEQTAADLHRLRARLDAPGRTSCTQLGSLLSPAFLEWARNSSGTSTSTRHDRTCTSDTCTSDTGTNTRGAIPGTWTAIVAHHHAPRRNTGALSTAAMPTFTRDRSTTVPCELYNDDGARWTVRLHTVAPHSRRPSGHLPWHIQSPSEPPRENLSAQHNLTLTCVLPGHGDSTTLPGRTADLAGATNRRLLHEHHLDIPSSVTSTALLDQLCPQCLHDALAPPPATDDAGNPAGDPAFVLLTWTPHDHTGTGTGEHEPCGRTEQPVPAGPPDEHSAPAEPDADAVLNTLKLLCDTTPGADRAVLDTVQLLGDTSLGTTRARTTRHAGAARATADIINRYNEKVRRLHQEAEKNAKTTRRLAAELRRHNDQITRYNQQRLRRRHITDTDTNSDTNSDSDSGMDTGTGTTSS